MTCPKSPGFDRIHNTADIRICSIFIYKIHQNTTKLSEKYRVGAKLPNFKDFPRHLGRAFCTYIPPIYATRNIKTKIERRMTYVLRRYCSYLWSTKQVKKINFITGSKKRVDLPLHAVSGLKLSPTETRNRQDDTYTHMHAVLWLCLIYPHMKTRRQCAIMPRNIFLILYTRCLQLRN